MLTLRTITGRLVLTTVGSTTSIRNEFSLMQARKLHAEIGEMIATLELREEQPGTLAGLIAQLNDAD